MLLFLTGEILSIQGCLSPVKPFCVVTLSWKCCLFGFFFFVFFWWAVVTDCWAFLLVANMRVWNCGNTNIPKNLAVIRSEVIFEPLPLFLSLPDRSVNKSTTSLSNQVTDIYNTLSSDVSRFPVHLWYSNFQCEHSLYSEVKNISFQFKWKWIVLYSDNFSGFKCLFRKYIVAPSPQKSKTQTSLKNNHKYLTQRGILRLSHGSKNLHICMFACAVRQTRLLSLRCRPVSSIWMHSDPALTRRTRL